MSASLLADAEAGGLTQLDKLEIQYSVTVSELLRRRDGLWSDTMELKRLAEIAGNRVLRERRRRGLPCSRGALRTALRKNRFPAPISVRGC